MTEVISLRDLISGNEPISCLNCKRNLAQQAINYVVEHADTGISSTECASLIEESLKRCRSANGCDEYGNLDKPLIRSI